MPHHDAISFTRGVPPDSALEHVARPLTDCLEAVLARDAARTLQYGQQSGYPPLKDILAAQFETQPSNIMIGNGSLQLQDLLASHLIGRKSGVVLTEQPTYDRALSTLRRRRAQIIGIPLEADGLSIGALETQLAIYQPDFLYLVPDFQNPTGITTSLVKRHAIVELADKHDFYIVEDIPYRQLRYRGRSLPMLRELSPERVITMSSYSKLLSPGLRVGYAVGPQEIIAAITALGEETYLSPVLITQATVAEFISRGRLDEQISWLKALYRPRLEAMLAAIHEHIPGAELHEPDGGFFVSLTLPDTANTQDLIGRADAQSLQLTTGAPFFTENFDNLHPDRFIRLPFCAVAPAQIYDGIARLASLI